MHHYLSASPQPDMLVAWISSLELEFLNRYKAFSLYTVSIIILPYRPPTQHTSYIPLCQVITICAVNTPTNNCSVGLRSWCNTYCLQPYTALFVFVFMAATLHSSFFKGFYYNSPWSEREIWSNLKEAISLKPRRPPQFLCQFFDFAFTKFL